MNYELALALKNAGFPQEGNWYWTWYEDDGWELQVKQYKEASLSGIKHVLSPTLSELVEACVKGNKSLQFQLIYTDAGWSTDIKKIGTKFIRAIILNQNTPEEAVAKLWLELNKD